METKPPVIILIEKDDVTLEIYQRELCKLFEVLSFTEIDGVLEVMANQNIQAVIIEPEISSGEGWKLIKSIDAAFPNQSIPVIVCSTRDTSDAGSLGCITKYLTKPVLPRELKEKTLEVIHRKR